MTECRGDREGKAASGAIVGAIGNGQAVLGGRSGMLRYFRALWGKWVKMTETYIPGPRFLFRGLRLANATSGLRLHVHVVRTKSSFAGDTFRLAAVQLSRKLEKCFDLVV